jgi:hypothetical protein
MPSKSANVKGPPFVTKAQSDAARKNVRKAATAAKKKRSLANMPTKTKTALGKQGAAVAQRKRTGGEEPKTRQELYEEHLLRTMSRNVLRAES